MPGGERGFMLRLEDVSALLQIKFVKDATLPDELWWITCPPTPVVDALIKR
jgi:hypothetical protein